MIDYLHFLAIIVIGILPSACMKGIFEQQPDGSTKVKHGTEIVGMLAGLFCIMVYLQIFGFISIINTQ